MSTVPTRASGYGQAMRTRFLVIAAAVIGGALGLVLLFDPATPRAPSIAGGGLVALGAAVVLLVASYRLP